METSSEGGGTLREQLPVFEGTAPEDLGEVGLLEEKLLWISDLLRRFSPPAFLSVVGAPDSV